MDESFWENFDAAELLPSTKIINKVRKASFGKHNHFNAPDPMPSPRGVMADPLPSPRGIVPDSLPSPRGAAPIPVQPTSSIEVQKKLQKALSIGAKLKFETMNKQRSKSYS